MTADEAVHVVSATVGFTSYALLWLTVVWGMVLRNGWATTRIRHSTLHSIHMTLALIGLTLAVVHAGTHLAVPGGHVRLIDQVVPFANPVDRIGIGVGVLATQIFVAAALSVVIQRKLGYARWRALHTLTHVAFMLVVGHILISGRHAGEPWVWGTVLASWLVAALLWLNTTPLLDRVLKGRSARAAARRRGEEITVNVDASRCARFAFCEHEAPDVFTLRNDGRLAYRAVVPAELATPVIRAAEVCPARAIALSRLPTTVMTPRRVEDENAGDAQEEPRGVVTGINRNGGRR